MFRLYNNIKEWFIGDFLSETDDFYQQAKIKLNFNFPFFTLLLFICFSVFLLIFQVEHSVYTVTGSWLMALAFLFFLKFTKNIQLSSFFLSSVIFIIVCANLLMNKQVLHLGFPYWLCIQLLFVVFNLGIYWGIVFGALGGTVFVFYRQNHLFETFELTKFDPNTHLITFIVEITLASFLLLYLIQLYLLTSRKSEVALKKQNQLLLEKNELIELQNAEKTIMLREIHHRVKNNLQVINSLLRLQAYEIKDPVALAAFDLSQKRIHAMALIHERLYKIEKMSDTISADYIELLVKDLVDLYKTNQQITLTISVQNGIVPQENIVPFGLIINELISNSLKHGIKDRGQICIKSNRENHAFKFEYLDNGIGFDAEIKKGFGLELIESLTEQLEGKVNYKNNLPTGVHFTFEFNQTI